MIYTPFFLGNMGYFLKLLGLSVIPIMEQKERQNKK